MSRAHHTRGQAVRRLLTGETHGAGFGLVARQDLLLGPSSAGAQCRISSNSRSKWSSITPCCGRSRRRNVRCPASLASSDHILDQRLSTMVSISFGNRLGGGQDARAEAGDREDGFRIFMGLQNT